MTKYPFLLFPLAASLLGAAGAAPLHTERVNVNPTTGAQADGPSSSPVLSADGCVVAFVSQSGTLANPSYGLTRNSPAQIYAVDRCVTPHTLELISVTSDGTAAADEACGYPNISADGRYVAFITLSGNLPVPGSAPDNSGQFVFVRDRVAQTTTSPLQAWRVTANTSGGISFSGALHRYMSADATRFTFEFYNSVTVPYNLYTFDVSGGATTLHAVCPSAAEGGAGACSGEHISSDGSTLVFRTDYPMTAGDTNGFTDVFAYDVASGVSTLASVNADQSQANQAVDSTTDLDVSGDGSRVAFASGVATNFPGGTTHTLLLKNLASGELKLISALPDGTPETLSDGFAVPQFSADGSRLAFNSENSALSPWMQYVVIDALVYDAAQTRLHSVCLSSSGSYGTLGCNDVTLSADGKWAALRSLSSNLVPGDTNDYPDIFVVAADAAVDLVFAAGFEM